MCVSNDHQNSMANHMLLFKEHSLCYFHPHDHAQFQKGWERTILFWKIRSQNLQVKCTNDNVSREQGVIQDSLKKEKQQHMAELIDKV